MSAKKAPVNFGQPRTTKLGTKLDCSSEVPPLPPLEKPVAAAAVAKSNHCVCLPHLVAVVI